MTEHPFHPDDIDEQIDRLSSSNPRHAASTDERMLHDMRLLLKAGDIDEQIEGDRASVERVWTTIAAKGIHTEATPDDRLTLERFTLMSTPSSQQKRPTTWGRRLGLLSVAAIVIVFLGSALALFALSQHDGQLNTSTAIPPTGTTVYTYHQPDYGIGSLQWTPDGKRIISTNNNVASWDALNGAHLIKYTNSPSGAVDIEEITWRYSQLSPDGKQLAIYHLDTIELYDTATGKRVKTLTHPSNLDELFVGYMHWSADSKSLTIIAQRRVIGSTGTTYTTILVTYDVVKGKMLQKQTIDQQEDLASIDWSPDGKYIAAGLRNTDSVYVFDSTNGKTISSHPGKHNTFGTITNPAWSPDSKRIAVHLQDGIHIWDAVTGKQVAVYKNGWNPVWSPNGKYIAVVGGDVDSPNDINILDATTGKTLYTYTGHRYDVSAIAWSPDSVYIASGERLLITPDGNIGRTSIVRVWVARP